MNRIFQIKTERDIIKSNILTPIEIQFQEYWELKFNCNKCNSEIKFGMEKNENKLFQYYGVIKAGTLHARYMNDNIMSVYKKEFNCLEWQEVNAFKQLYFILKDDKITADLFEIICPHCSAKYLAVGRLDFGNGDSNKGQVEPHRLILGELVEAKYYQ